MKTWVFFIFTLLLFACEKRLSKPEREATSEIRAVSSMVPTPAKQTDAAESPSERKLIKTAFLTIEVGDVNKTRGEIEKISREHHAYISSEIQSGYDDRVQYEQVLRIPSAHFDTFVKKIEALGTEVKNKNVRTEDVTEEFIDKEARIKTKKELEDRYREILKQAKEIKDILAIEAQLNQVRADIESMEGRINYLRNQVAFSTLSLSFYEPIGPESGFGSKAIAAFTNGWDMLIVLVLGLMNLWPLMVGAAVLYLVFRRNHFRKNVSTAGPDSE